MSRRMKVRNKIGVYGPKTRQLQSTLSQQLFGFTNKTANVYKYLGSRASIEPNINDITTVFHEVPDRAYSDVPVEINIAMEPLQEQQMDFSRFGLINPLSNEQTFRVHESDFKCLGREIIIGDVFEVPFFLKNCDKAFWEVTDVDDKPSYEKFYYTIQAVPLGDSRTTREIPIERSNEGLMSDLMDQDADRQQREVEYEGLDPTRTEDWDGTMPSTDVDYRSEEQESFLDDPTKDFTNED